MIRVACAGLITVDLLFDVPGHPAHGSKMRALGSRMTPGGGALIAASAVASLGGQASLAGAVGDDALGDLVRATLAARGVDAALVQSRAGIGTARSAVLIAPDGERTIINHREQALFEAQITLPEPFRFDAALADTRWPGGAATLLRAARAAGKPGVLDAEAPVARAAEALAAASHIVFSEQGLRDYAGGSDAAALAMVAARLGCFVAVTRGARPVLCHGRDHGRDGAFAVDAFPTRAVDTLGAGDVWHAAFALSLAQGQDCRAAVRFANAAAAVRVARPGHFPTAAEVHALLARHGEAAGP
jgi:sulfofructose kinase